MALSPPALLRRDMAMRDIANPTDKIRLQPLGNVPTANVPLARVALPKPAILAMEATAMTMTNGAMKMKNGSKPTVQSLRL
jgi:hypothetical protein